MSEHTPGPWSHNGIRPYTIEDGTVAVEGDAPPSKWVIKRVWRDEQGRRCTQFVAEAYVTGNHEAETEPNARLIALAPELYEYVASSASAGCATAKALMERI